MEVIVLQHIKIEDPGYIKDLMIKDEVNITTIELDEGEIIPKDFYSSNNLKKTGLSGIFAGSLELAKEGNISIKQNKLFDDVFIKEKNE